MAIEKILNTRIGLKVDTLENWNKSTLPLKKGEVAFATVSATAGVGLSEPVVMMKIGEDGVKTFKDIEWNFYAKASDVLSACKSEEGLRTFINGVIADAGIASSDAMEVLAGRVTNTENDIKTLKSDENTDGSVAKAIKVAIDALDLTNELAKKVDKEEGKSLISDSEIARLTTLHNYDDTQVRADIAKKADSETMTTELGKKVDKMEGYSLVSNVEIERLSKVDNYNDSALTGRVSNLETASATHAIKTEVEGALVLKADKSVVEAMYTNDKIDELIQGAKDYADNNDADTKYGIVYDSDNKKIKLVEGGSEVEIDATEFIKDGMIETVTIGEDNDIVITFNTAAGKENIVLPLDQLVDIYTGVEGARVKVTVASDKSISADLVAGSISKNYLDEGVQASLALADSALQSHQDISHLAVKTQVATDIATAKGEAIADAATKYEQIGVAQGLVDALGTMSKETATDYVKKSEAVGYGDILTKTDAQGLYQAKGEYYTKTEAENKFTDSTEVDGQIDAKISALDLANTYQAKGNYASAEQGAKADSALQTITTTANNGLKVTNNNNIEIDDTITWVFDCGNSGVTA